MAKVYLAIQENFQRKVAVKILSERLLSDPGFCERFLREARIVAQLSHQHIVPVFDVGQHGDNHYIAMELLQGGDLKQRLEKGLPLAQGLDIIGQVASALNYASNKNFVHRDIKPENILFREDDSAVVSDFGIARSTESETNMTLTGTIIGTPSYMSPEQAQALPLDGRSDLYSLGIILFEMLTGNVPFTADSAISIGLKHITEPIPELPDELSDFQEIIDKALAKSPEDRFQNGQEFVDALIDVEHNLHQSSSETMIISAADLKRRRNTTGRGASGRGTVARARSARRSSGASSDGRNKSGTALRSPKSGRQHPQELDQSPSLFTRKGLLAASVASVVVLSGVGGWWYYNNKINTNGGFDSVQSQAFDEKTKSLLTKAELAMSEKRWYSPINNNAQEYYTTALALAPGNAKAIEGVESLITMYLDAAQAAMAKNKKEKAIEWLNRAAQIGFYANNQQLMERQQKIRLDVFQLQQKTIRMAENQRQVQALLEEGNKALKEKRFTSPVDDNAYDKFQSVLALDPINKEAMSGIKAIATSYLEQANQQAINENFVSARALMAAAIQIDSQHPQLVTVQQSILKAEEDKRQRELKVAQQQAYSEANLLRQKEESKRQRAREIGVMLASANDDLKNNRLQLPAGNNAVEKFRTVLSLDPSNLQALEGLQNVGEKYVTLANDALKNKTISDAETYLNVAQKLIPNSKTLLTARQALLDEKERIARDRDLQQQRERQIAKLLIDAKADESEGRYSSPIGNNALEKYAQILGVDANNVSAIKGRKKIADTLISDISQYIARNKFDKSEAAIATLKRFFPNNPQLTIFRKNLDNAKTQFAKRQNEINKLLTSANKLEKSKSSAGKDRKLRSVYSKILKLDVANQPAKQGLNKISNSDVKKAKSSIKLRKYEEAKKIIDLALKYTPKYKPVRAVKKELDEAIRIETLVKNHISIANNEFLKPNFLSDDDIARQALKTAYENIQQAKKLDSDYPQISVVTTSLEGNYVKAIQYFSEIKSFDRGKSLINDALAMDIPKQRINEQKLLLEARKKDSDQKEKKRKLTRQMGVF